MSDDQILRQHLGKMPVMAMLRGLAPEHAAETGRLLFDAGIRVMEVPLNGPGGAESVAALTGAVGDDVLVGGGTVRTLDDLSAIANAGGRLAVMPHLDAALVIGALDVGLVPVPGVFTPSEAFAALDAGAAALKLFPAQALSPDIVAAWRAVMPPEDAVLIPSGGIDAANAGDWLAAGASGVGVGNALFDAGGDMEETRRKANAFADAIKRAP
ncbi:MAG: 2-dehydro-3-deoxy-6-phosphogalactonate aldolase [Parvibaculaceae bacterium]